MDSTSAEYLRDVLRETREELSRADQKASILLAAVGVSAAAIVGGAVQAKLSPLAMPLAWQLVCWLGVLGTIGSIILLGAAVYPSIGQPDSTRLHYFGDFAEFNGSVEQLHAALGTSPDDFDSRTLSQIAILSSVAVRKFRLVQVGMISAAAGVGAIVLSIVGAS